MTKREMLEMVAAGNVNDEVMGKAQELIAAMDAANVKRAGKAAEKRAEKLEAEKVLEEGILEILTDEPVTASQIHEVVEGIGSPQKATVVAKRLVEAGVASQVDVKVNGRKVKGYVRV